MKVNFLDMDSTPPLIKMLNYKNLRRMDRVRDGVALSKEEWIKVIKGGNAVILEYAGGMAETMRNKKDPSKKGEGEFSMSLGGNTFDELSGILMEIHEKQYGRIDLDAAFLAAPIKDVFERKRKVENFLYFLALIRTADAHCDLNVLIPDENDTDMKERILSSGADSVLQRQAKEGEVL